MAESIINTIATNILDIVIAILSIIVSTYLIPYIKNDFIPLLKEKRLYTTVRTLVEGVEQMADAGIIEKSVKKERVIALLQEQGIEVTPAVEAVIEAAVKAMNDTANAIVEEVTKE